MAAQILTWWLVLQLFGLLGLPIAAFLFRSLPDRGYAFSKSLGLLLTGYGAWVLAMLGLGSFSLPLLLLVMLLLAVLGLLLVRYYWQVPLRPGPLIERLLSWLGASWRGLLAYELLFLLALVGVAWIRAYSPHPWGTERPMDLAFFNAIRYSAAFPPADPWLAGFSINYYYFGYLLMAVVAMLSGLQPAVAYNLSLAGIFALAALGIAGIVANLISLVLARREQPQQPPVWLHFWRYPAALLGVVLVLLVGNQAGALQVIVGDYRVVALDGRQLVAAVAQALGSASDQQEITLPYPARTTDFGTIETLQRTNSIDDFNWWWPSRALWDAQQPFDAATSAENAGVRRYNITEFPFFSFWLGDMHPHVMALPFNLLVMVLALATMTRATLPQFAMGRAGWLELLLTGLLLGSLYMINSWDLPTYVLLYSGALLLLYRRLCGPFTRGTWRAFVQQLALVVLALLLLFVPFYLTFHSLVGFREPLINVPILARLTTIIAPFIDARSGLLPFLVISGLFLIPLIGFVYLASLSSIVYLQPAASEAGSDAPRHGEDAPPAAEEPRTRQADDESPAGGGRIVVGQSGAHGALLLQEQAVALPQSRAWRLPLLLLPPLLLVAGLLVGFPLLFLAGVGLLAFVQAWQRPHTPALGFVLLVVALGCAICFGTELIYIRDVFSNRMNTIFKFYYQVWLLWGTVAAFALWWLLAVLPREAGSGRAALARRGCAYAVAGGALLLLLGGLVYPAVNVRNMVYKGQFVGLHGLTPREQNPAAQAATRWLRENTPPGSVVLEMVDPDGGSYNGAGYGAISASTGRPTVLGWYGHQIQWRGGDAAAREELEPRKNDVTRIYSTGNPDEARELLRKYDVDYVYVGPLERQAAGEAGLAKFTQIATPVFQEGEVTIYQLPGE